MKLVNAETKENGRALPNGIGNMVRLQKSSHDNTLNIDAVLPKLTTLEKISLLSGSDNWHTNPLPKYGIPAVRMKLILYADLLRNVIRTVSDGPNGVRGTFMFNGIPSSCFPCSTGIACSFDLDLIREIGEALAEECKKKGVHVLLAPTVNTQRSPLGGRGFESFSEDPHLSGTIAAAYINAVQAGGVIATIKHFVNGDQETDRKTFNAVVSARAQREIYMKPFQIAIKKSKPGVLMTAYNRVNGIHASESSLLIEDILRNEWRYDGLIMSDWSGTYSCTRAIKAGLDLEMPGPSTVRGAALFRAVVAGKVTLADLDERARKVLDLVVKAQKSGIPFDAPQLKVDTPQLRKLLRRSAADAIVLLKNELNELPLSTKSSKPVKSIAVFGYNANIAVTSGGGAAELLPSYTVTPLEGIRAAAQEVLGIHPEDIKYATGALAFRFIPLISRYLRLERGGHSVAGGIVEFWNEPFDIDGTQSAPPLFIADTYLSEMRLNDHIPDTVAQTCWYRYSGIFVPDEDGDWEFSVVVAGQANLYIDAELVVDNTTEQELGTYFLAQGSVEEKGTVRGMKANQEYHFEVRATNEIALNNSSPYKTRGALRVGAWKTVSDEEALNDAITLATKCDVAIVVVGLTHEFEAEAFDRPDMNLPGHADNLVAAILKANPRTIVITQSGMPLEMPWLDDAPTMLHAFYGGNELGHGLADVLFGIRNPSGKLPLSWPRRLSNSPSYTSFGGDKGNVIYGEGIYVGYRHPNFPVAFPFGHGLGYTTFRYSALSIPNEICISQTDATLSISFLVANTGDVWGGEIVQIYISDLSSSLHRPEKELKGFSKVWLRPKEEKRVTIELDREAWAFWDDSRSEWVAEQGVFSVHIGASSEDIRLSGQVTLGQDVVWRGL